MVSQLFLVRGDLTKLACDALLVPTDADLNVRSHWSDVLPEGLSVGPWDLVLSPTQVSSSAAPGVRRLSDTSRGRDVWMVDTVTPRTPEGIADVIAAAVDAAAEYFRDRTPANGRARHLVALPLVGVGGAGHSDKRGRVLARLLERLSGSPVDVVLVLSGLRDYIAAQNIRHEPPSLGQDLDDHAERLSNYASTRDLVLFLGAGVSAAAGLPTWASLIEELAKESDLDLDSMKAASVLDAAEAAQQRMGDRFYPFMRQRFELNDYSLAHGLLANLGADNAVTTNYDNGYELAMAGAGRSLRVLTRQRAASNQPWLLKMHGDIENPESIVLTRRHYLEFGETGTPLAGMVQALLMTKHMLFVGFSLVDDNFAKLAFQVRRTLELSGDPAKLGTILQLHPDAVREVLWGGHLIHVSMTGAELSESARELEIFLDRVGWLATRARGRPDRYLLDTRYDDLPRAQSDTAVGSALRAAWDQLSATERSSLSGVRLRRLLERLGADPGSLAG